MLSLDILCYSLSLSEFLRSVSVVKLLLAENGEKKPIFLPSTDAGHPGKSPSAAINAAVPGRTESVPGHNTFSWGDRGPAVFTKVMGKFWPVSLRLLLFSVSLSPSLGFDCAKFVPGCSWWPIPHQGHHCTAYLVLQKPLSV